MFRGDREPDTLEILRARESLQYLKNYNAQQPFVFMKDYMVKPASVVWI